MNHTPTPWEVRHYDGPLIKGNVISAGGKDLAILNCGEEDAAFIIKAVNSYQEMLAILKEAKMEIHGFCSTAFPCWPICLKIDKAIAKAEGK